MKGLFKKSGVQLALGALVCFCLVAIAGIIGDKVESSEMSDEQEAISNTRSSMTGTATTTRDSMVYHQTQITDLQLKRQAWKNKNVAMELHFENIILGHKEKLIELKKIHTSYLYGEQTAMHSAPQ